MNNMEQNTPNAIQDLIIATQHRFDKANAELIELEKKVEYKKGKLDQLDIILSELKELGPTT